MPAKMKLLSPKLYELDELGQVQQYSSMNNQKNDTYKYISIYRKALRNSNGMNSSRTDLKIQENDNSDYINNFAKTGMETKILDMDTGEVPPVFVKESQRASQRKNVCFEAGPERSLNDFALPVIN